jgi:predicted dithiol-disulfide oxidoreductase (DUF899 family)
LKQGVQQSAPNSNPTANRGSMSEEILKDHRVVSETEWLDRRRDLLVKEKEFTRLRDQLNQQRRMLPWVKVQKQYVFDSQKGSETLVELFDGRSQLIIYHFMFDPSWDEGCKHCSFWADHFDGIGVHLNHRDGTMVAVSRAPLSKIELFKKRMGWNFKWVSSFHNDFNYDYQVTFTPKEIETGAVFYNYAQTKNDSPEREGASVFYKDESGVVFHTYSCYARGIDLLNGTYNYLDLVPKGRDEGSLEFTQEWVRYHDKY